jgi:alkaline phosphatase
MSLAAVLAAPAVVSGQDQDRLKDLQDAYVANQSEKVARAYHFGSQGAGDVFSNHTSHTNRLVPVYVFGTKAKLGDVTGANSRYRTEEGVKALYGRVPEHTVNPDATYADQSDLYRVQKEAVDRGAKYVFTIWFDGMDWDTVRAAALIKTGKDMTEGPGNGLIFQSYARPKAGPMQFGSVVTSPTHEDPRDEQFDVNTQVLSDLSGLLGGGYDARVAGPNPWTPGKLKAPGYLKGQSGDAKDKAGVTEVGGVVHAYTDSAPSAGEYATGVKMFNNGLNFNDSGRAVPTLMNQLQAKGWKVGTVTSVPFNHASPAAMYAHNVSRDDYQDLAREMLGLESIVQATGKGSRLPGLDVVIGCGWGCNTRDSDLKKQGKNAVAGNIYITSADKKAIDARNGGKYVVAERTPGVNGTGSLQDAADAAARSGKRLFGFYGMPVSGHLPYRTADGQYNPARGVRGVAEKYQPADLEENPKLDAMTRAALTVLAAKPGQPFALFVEAGDVDFALHDNNLDNAVGALYSGEAAIRVILEWIEKNNAWDDSVVIATADHGHYLVIDDPAALSGLAPSLQSATSR